MYRTQRIRAGNLPHAKAVAASAGTGRIQRICTLMGNCVQSVRLEKVWDRRTKMKNWKLPLIIVGTALAIALGCAFGVQSSQNKAISLEESVYTA